MNKIYPAMAAALALSATLAGCAPTTYPIYGKDGNYYLGGDAKCRNGAAVDGKLMCRDKNYKLTGETRDPLPSWWMDHYRIYQSQAQAQAEARAEQNTLTVQQITQTLNEFNKSLPSLQQSAQQIQNQAQQTPVPAVQPITPQQPNNAIVYCRDLSGNIIMCKQLN